MMRLALFALLASAGCIKTNSVTCGDGGVCAADHVCDEVHNTCVFPDQLVTCKGMADGTLCDIRGMPGGTCKDEVCIPATCGDELVTGEEVCDGAADIPTEGTCVDFAYDYGALSCNALCTEGFGSCHRLGWELRSINGVGRIGGIWEDGGDLWLANQLGIYRRHNGVWDPLVQPTGMVGWYHGIWAMNGHAFAVANDGSVAHWNGTTWTSQILVPGGQLFGVWGRSEEEVYAVGGKAGTGSVWRYGGNTWTEMTLPPSTALLRAVWGTDTKVFAVGDAVQNVGTVVIYDGTWKPSGVPANKDLTSVWGTAANYVFAVGNTPANDSAAPEAKIFYYNGLQWVEQPIPFTEELHGISGRAQNEVFAVGARPGSNILFYDGASWAPMVSGVNGKVLGLASVHAGPSGVFAAKRPNLLLEYNDAGWAETLYTAGEIRGIWATGPDYAISVGDGLFFHELVNGNWGSVPYPPCWGTTTTFVSDVWGSSPRDVWIVGPYGKLLRRTTGVSCVDIPSGKWIHDVWGSGPNDVFAVGASGDGTQANLVHFDGNTWSDWSDRVMPLVPRLDGVWGFSATNVYAVGDSKVLHYNGSTWSDAGLVTTEKLGAIWGSSPTDIFAVGSNGAIFHSDGSTWTRMFVPVGLSAPTDASWTKVHGTGPNDVYVVGSRTMMRYDGSSWAPIARLEPSRVGALWSVPGAVFTGGEGGMHARLLGKLK
jgi:hypothetical protein